MRQQNKRIWPYRIKTTKIDNSTHTKILGWCNRTCEYDDWYSYPLTYHRGYAYIFAFKDEETLLAFKLTFGEYNGNKECI